MALSGRALVVLLAILGIHSASAAQYTVGQTGGWTLQSNSNTVYTDQFTSIQLFVGDTLSFPYTAPVHNVWEISPTDLAACNFANPIATYNASNAVITLTTAGVHAYGCEVVGHCSAGMQLSVTVLEGGAPSSPPTATPVTTPPGSVPVTEGSAPGPIGPGDSSSSIISSGSAMSVAAIVAGFALLLV